MLTTAATTLATTAAALPAHFPGHGSPGFGWWFLLIPLFWILLFGTLFAIFGRRWRRAARDGYGPGARLDPVRQAEATLAERFAQGDIDETEYRARLEVLRANAARPS